MDDLAVMRRMRADPAYFVRLAFGVTPTAQQAQLLAAAAKSGARVSVSSGHGTGKTTTLAWIILWHVACFPDSKAPCTAPTFTQLSNVLWSEVGKWHSKMREPFKSQIEVTSEQVFLKERRSSQFAVARTASKEHPEAFQGFHAKNLLFIVDESSGVPEPIFQAAEGALSTPGARVVMCSNPTRLTGYFAESHRGPMRERWVRLKFSCLDSPLVSPEYVEQMKAKYGEGSDVYRVRVLGEFPNASTLQFMPLDLVEAALGRGIRPEAIAHAPKVVGVDVARFGDDRTVIVRRQGLAVVSVEKHRGLDTMTTASLVARHADDFGARAVFVDDCGLGGGVTDRLRQLGYRVIAVNAGSKSATPDKHANKRAEMWEGMRDWLAAGGCLPNDPDLRDDLIGPEYGFDAKNRLALESKDEMKKRGIASPDIADALALTFAQPVHVEEMLPFHAQRRDNQAYDRQSFRAGRRTV